MRRALAAVLVVTAAAALAAAGARAIYAQRKVDTLQTRALPLRLEGAVPARLLLIGDSRIAQWPLEMLPEGAAKSGYPGATSVNIATAAPAVVNRAKASAVVIQMGYNDSAAAAFLPPEQARVTAAAAVDRINAVARIARRAGAGQVIVITVAPANDPPLWRRWLYASAQERLVASINQRLRQESLGLGIQLLDADRLLRRQDGSMDPRFRTDSTHWSRPAYELLSRELTAMLANGAPRGDSGV